jgi:hypothetical protein
MVNVKKKTRTREYPEGLPEGEEKVTDFLHKIRNIFLFTKNLINRIPILKFYTF